jgi:hypothetical protein
MSTTVVEASALSSDEVEFIDAKNTITISSPTTPCGR